MALLFGAACTGLAVAVGAAFTFFSSGSKPSKTRTDEYDEVPKPVRKVCRSAYGTTDPYGWLVKYAAASTIYMDTLVFEEYKKFQGRLEYYICTTEGVWGHRMIILRDAAQKKRAVLCHLAVSRDGWYVRIEQTKWQPGQNEVKQGKHVWDLAHVLEELVNVMKSFGEYNILEKNCRTFVREIMDAMIASSPGQDFRDLELSGYQKLCRDHDHNLNVMLGMKQRWKM